MAFDFKKEEDVKQYLENIGIEYRFGCYSEKNPEVCHLLGMYFDVVKKDIQKAKKVYKVNCDTYGWGLSCYKYALLTNNELKDKFGFTEEIIDYFKRGCETGLPECAKSCYFTGVKMGKQAETQKEQKGKKEKYLKAIEYMDRACNFKLGQACFNLGSIYFDGIPEADIPKDIQMVHDYHLKGCEYNNLHSCINLSVLYAKGHGCIEKNLDLAKKYKKIAVELHKQMTGMNPELSFEQGID